MVLSIRPTPQYKNMTASSRQVCVTLNAMGNVCVYVCVSSKPLLTIDHHFFPMTLSIHPGFKRGRRNRMTGVGGNVWGKCKCSCWLLQTAGLAWVGFFKQLLLVGRKQLLTDEKINITEKHRKLLSLFSFSCDELKGLRPSPEAGTAGHWMYSSSLQASLTQPSFLTSISYQSPGQC